MSLIKKYGQIGQIKYWFKGVVICVLFLFFYLQIYIEEKENILEHITKSLSNVIQAEVRFIDIYSLIITKQFISDNCIFDNWGLLIMAAQKIISYHYFPYLPSLIFNISGKRWELLCAEFCEIYW